MASRTLYVIRDWKIQVGSTDEYGFGIVISTKFIVLMIVHWAISMEKV